MNRTGSLFSIAALLFWLGLVVGLQAGDWPQFRGPNRDGIWNEPGVMRVFPPAGLTVQWRTPTGGGLSSPIVSEGRVFLCDSELKKPQAWECVHCYDEKTGRQLWVHKDEVTYPDWAFDPKSAAGPDATPLIHGGKLYVMGRMGHVLCLNGRDGGVLWQSDLGKQYGPENIGTTPSPLIEGNLLILVVGGKPDACVMALDKDTGAVVWHALDDKWTYSTPLVITAGGKRQLIVWTPDAVVSLDPLTGKTWWREKRETRGDFTAAAAVADHDLLFVGGMMFRLAADQPAATVLWPDENTSYTRRILSQTSVPLLADGCVFSEKSHGYLIALDALTGKLCWQTDKVTNHGTGAMVQIFPDGDSVLLFTDEGSLIRARLSRQGYEELSRVHFIDPTSPFAGHQVVWPLPAFANGHVFGRNSRELICASLEPKE